MVCGQCYFFTATILNWQPLLISDHNKQILIDECIRLVEFNRIRIYAFVIMPNHYHLLWSINEKYQPENIQRDFHEWTARQLIKSNTNDPLRMQPFRVEAADRAIQIWERNPLAVKLFTEAVIWNKVDYIHNNPCSEKWRLAKHPEDYKYSSANYYLHNKKSGNFLTHIRDA